MNGQTDSRLTVTDDDTDKNSVSLPDVGRPKAHRFLLFVAELLHRYGTPSFRFEAAMAAVSRSAGLKGSYLYTPTSFIASLEEEGVETTYLRRVDAEEVDIDKLLLFDETLERLNAKEISVEQAHARLTEYAHATPLYNSITSGLAGAVVCAGVAALFGGGFCDIVIAFVLGTLVSTISWIAKESGWDNSGWVHPLSGFVAGLGAIAVAYVLPIDYRVTTLAVLILPIPGLSLTIALTELAVGHLSAGSARFAGAMTRLLTLGFGVAVAWKIAGGAELAPAVANPVPAWCEWLSLVIAPLAFGVIFRSPVSIWPAIVATSLAGSTVSRLGGAAWGAELGAFFGALVIGTISNLYARTYNRPAMALLTPGLLILVPGSIGYRSITAIFEHNTAEGVQLAATMLMTAVSLVGGILMANAIMHPKRCL